MHVPTLAAFIALEFLLCLIPGPAVMAVVGASFKSGRSGFATAGGIVSGNSLYFVVSALGIASVILASHQAFTVVKWCGAVYLAYLGVRALSAKDSGDRFALTTGAAQLTRGWASGTIVQLANPKALIFFAAILPQFIDPRGDLVLQVAVLGAASQIVEFLVLSGYVIAADKIRQRGIGRSQLWAERIGGLFLLGVAAAVAREA